jgi:hypothetical protein
MTKRKKRQVSNPKKKKHPLGRKRKSRKKRRNDTQALHLTKKRK